MQDLDALRREVNDVFVESFGRTPLKQRLDDILKEALELNRYTDLANLREEGGDLLASLLQFCTECGWDPAELVHATLEKIRSRRLQYATLGRKTTVALLGAAFDPITLGHIQVARFVLNTSRTFDEVWLMPCYEHMGGKRMAAAEHRLEMCRLAARRDGRIKVFDYEIRRQFRGETYHFVKRLQGEDFARDQYEFSFIMGQDNANSFPTWPGFEDLERMIRFVVVPRRGVQFAPSAAWCLKPPHISTGSERIPSFRSARPRSAIGSGRGTAGSTTISMRRWSPTSRTIISTPPKEVEMGWA